MTDRDIVERLNDTDPDWALYGSLTGLCRDARDAITTLRSKNERLRAAAALATQHALKIMKLRATLEKAETFVSDERDVRFNAHARADEHGVWSLEDADDEDRHLVEDADDLLAAISAALERTPPQ